MLKNVDTEDEFKPKFTTDAITALTRHNWPGNVRELKNILMRAMMFRKGSIITANDVIEACQSENSVSMAVLKQSEPEYVDSILGRLEIGEGNFWSQVHQPFKKNQLTRGTVKELIQTARTRYQANLPGLAIKLGACSEHYQSDPDESKKFTSFKNFLYKTVKISEPN